MQAPGGGQIQCPFTLQHHGANSSGAQSFLSRPKRIGLAGTARHDQPARVTAQGGETGRIKPVVMAHPGTPQNRPRGSPGHEHRKAPSRPAVRLMHAAKCQATASGLIDNLNAKANMPRPFAPHRSFKRRHFPAQGFNPGILGGLKHTR